MIRSLSVLLLAFGSLMSPAVAAESITVVCNASVQFAPLFYGHDSGVFSRHGLDVSVKMIGLNSNIPPLLVSGSAQIGGTTPTVLLQAVDNGLSLVAVSGAGIADRDSRDAALLVRSDSPIAAPSELRGKRVGVPGIGAILDVLFRNWLVTQKVDPAQVQFVETDLAQQMEALRGGNVDAVIGNNPSMQRIVSSGTGKTLAYFTETLPSTVPMVVYAASTEWVAGHARELAEFRAANEEAVAHVMAHPEDGRAAMGSFLRMPENVLKDVTMPAYQAEVKSEQMQVVIKIMQQQNMLQSHLDAAKLVAP